MKRLLLSAAISSIVASGAYAEHSAPDGSKPSLGTSAAPAQYKETLQWVEDQRGYKSEVSKYLHIRGSRHTTLSNLMPIAEMNPLMVAPTQDYIFYKAEDRNLLDSYRVSDAIDTNPGYPTPPTPTTDFTDEFEIKARMVNAYSEVNNSWSHAIGTLITDSENRLILLGMKNDFDDFELSDGRSLEGSDGKRDSVMFSYGRKMGQHVLSYSYLGMDLDNVGIPAATMDLEYGDVDAHIVSYEFAGDGFDINGEVRRINVDRNLNTYDQRPWLPASTGTDQLGDFTTSDPNATLPLPPAYTNPVDHLYFGEINSIIDAKQGIDVWEYHFDISAPVAGGIFTAGVDGVLNDISIKPTKPADDPRFTNLPANPNVLAGLTPASSFVGFAGPDWAAFEVNPVVDEDTNSVFAEFDKPLTDKTDLHVGARLSLHSVDQTLTMNPEGVDGRFLMDVLGLRYLLENTYGVRYVGTSQSGLSNNDNVNKDFLDADEETIDLVGRLSHKLNNNVTVSGSLSYYEEQPNGFERTFQAGFDPASNTLDGQIYFGNHDLEKEKHKRIDLAISYDNLDNFYGQARVWYDHVDDYIQGVGVIETTNDAQELEAFYELACGSAQYTPEPLKAQNPLLVSDPLTVGWAPDGEGFGCQSANPLRYDNIDAELYGVDFSWGYKITEDLLFNGVAAYQRGKRRDTAQIHLNSPGGAVDPKSTNFPPIAPVNQRFAGGPIKEVEDDDLYRIMPAYTHMALTYVQPMWQATLEGTFYMEQDKTSSTAGAIFNKQVSDLTADDFKEDKTGGYGVVNTIFSFTPHPALRLDAGVNNLFDKQYTNHLTGINRRWNNDSTDATSGSKNDNWLDYGDRIPGLGRNAFVKLTLGIKWPLPKGGM